jgi:hypothetical protein
VLRDCVQGDSLADASCVELCSGAKLGHILRRELKYSRDLVQIIGDGLAGRGAGSKPRDQRTDSRVESASRCHRECDHRTKRSGQLPAYHDGSVPSAAVQPQ